MTVDAPTVRVLTVCSHNRTRSVMIAAMLQPMLDQRVGEGGAIVESAGFGRPGLPAIPDAVAAMAARGLDVSAHRSRPVTDALLADSDLVLTAERDHVVQIAMMSYAAFPSTMTLPEFLARADGHPPLAGEDLGRWIAQLTEDRTASAYLGEHIAEIVDPTGTPRRAFAAAVERLERDCARVAELIAVCRPR